VKVQVGMNVRSGDGELIGRVEALEVGGFRVGGELASWQEVIEVKDGEVWVATHRVGLEELAKASPR
jgi:hypothetical protein